MQLDESVCVCVCASVLTRKMWPNVKTIDSGTVLLTFSYHQRAHCESTGAHIYMYNVKVVLGGLLMIDDTQ